MGSGESLFSKGPIITVATIVAKVSSFPAKTGHWRYVLLLIFIGPLPKSSGLTSSLATNN